MNTRLKFICFLLFSVASVPVLSQDFQINQARAYISKSYTTTDGLVNNTVLSMTQDKHGYLWIGTAEGLSRFD
jgi:ligand-binding sensor domain-containing protein